MFRFLLFVIVEKKNHLCVPLFTKFLLDFDQDHDQNFSNYDQIFLETFLAK